jgi:hypothetical protein
MHHRTRPDDPAGADIQSGRMLPTENKGKQLGTKKKFGMPSERPRSALGTATNALQSR